MSLNQAKVGDGEDMISNLPDVLLTRILSFLSTKEAIRTGILSTRWKSIWASLPTLDLSEEDFGLDEIINGFSFSRQADGDWVHGVPGCLVSHLKTIKISGFLGRYEMEKISYFLKNAKVLEKMTLINNASWRIVRPAKEFNSMRNRDSLI